MDYKALAIDLARNAAAAHPMYITYHFHDGCIIFGDSFTTEPHARAWCEYVNNSVAMALPYTEYYTEYEPGQSLYAIAGTIPHDATVTTVPF